MVKGFALHATNAKAAAIVDKGAFAFLGGEGLIGGRIIDQACNQLAFTLKRDGNREDGNGVQKIRGTVERVDDPTMGWVVTFDLAALLHQEAVARARTGKLGMNDIFGAVIGGADKICRTLERDLKLLDLAEIAREAAAGFAGGGKHNVDQRG